MITFNDHVVNATITQTGNTATFTSSIPGIYTVTATSAFIPELSKEIRVLLHNFEDLNIEIQKNITAGNTEMTLTQDYIDDSGFPITINGFIIINGNGHTLNFNHQNNNNININSTYTVTLKNLILINGNNEKGGAINNTGTLTLENTTFNNNTATTDGGAIENYANLNIINSTFTNNTVTTHNGGAIHNAGSAALNITNSTFTLNTANEGGAIYTDGNLNIVNSTFINNTANRYGGAIYNNGVLNISGSTFTGNTANSSRGGAIYNNYMGNIHMLGVNILLNISGSTFTGNTAGNEGGAIYNIGNLTLESITFTNNTAEYYGGAIGNYGVLNISGSTFTGNTAYEGGAINNYKGSIYISDTIFQSNTADLGGAIYTNDNLTIVNTNFTNNTANRYGGAIENYGVLNISGSTFTGNTAFIGGVIYNPDDSITNISFSSFINNTATMAGGAIYNTGGTVIANGNYWGNLNPTTDNLVNFVVEDYYRFLLTGVNSTFVGNEITLTLGEIVLNTTNDPWIGPALNMSATFSSNPTTATLTPNGDTVSFNASAAEEYNVTASKAGGISTIAITVDPGNSSLTVDANRTLVNGTLVDGYNNPIANVNVNITVRDVSQIVTTDAEGKFSLTLTETKAGDYDVTVSFNNTNYNSSTATTSFNITLLENITVNPISSVYGVAVPFIGVFTSNNLTTVDFIVVKLENNNTIAVGVVNTDGSVLFYIPGTSTIGSHTLSFYHNDKLLNTTTWRVEQIPTSLTMSINPVYEGYTLNVIVTLKAGNQALAGKNVSFTGYSNIITNSKGQAILKINNTAAKKYTITAQYNGETNYKSSKVSTTTTVKPLAISKSTPRNNQKGYKTRTIVITFNQNIKKYSNKYYSRIYVRNLKTKRKIVITKKIVRNKLYITMKTRRTARTYYQIYIPRYGIVNSVKKTITKVIAIKFRT